MQLRVSVIECVWNALIKFLLDERTFLYWWCLVDADFIELANLARVIETSGNILSVRH